MLKVFGHLNPDTDTVASAIAYAWYLTNQRATPATPYMLGELNKETAFVLGHLGLPVPERLRRLSEADQVVIVDTNNPLEVLPEIADAELMEVVDHHMLTGGLSTGKPIRLTMRPVASTATIIWQMADQEGFNAWPAEIAGVMLAALLSDTLKLTSPTTTDTDRNACAALVKISGQNMDELASGMFAAKSDLTGMSAMDILTMDSKVLPVGDKKVRISSLETTLVAPALAMKDELKAAMVDLKALDGIDGMFLFIVDILESQSVLIPGGEFEREVAERGFGVSFEGDTVTLPGVVSRKKQMLPAIEKGISQ